MLKSMIYAGFGAATIMKESIEEEVQRLQEKGKIKSDDAKSFLDSLQNRGEEEESRLKEMLKNSIKEVIDELGLATKEDIEKLKETIYPTDGVTTSKD